MAIPVLSQLKQDLANDRIYTARYVGQSVKDGTRITVHSGLTQYDDKVDTYRFRVTKGGFPAIAVTASKELRIEVLQRNGRVIADSQGTAAQKSKYEDIQSGDLEFKNGDYYIRISRTADTPKTEKIEYYFQILNGEYKKDYDTEETPPAKPAISAKASTIISASLASSISSSLNSLLSEDNFFSQLQSIASGSAGTVGSDVFDMLDSRATAAKSVDFIV